MVKYVSNQNVEVLKEIAENGNVLCVTPKKNGFAKIFKSNHIKIDYAQEAIYYVDKDDADCYRIMLCSKLKKTLVKLEGGDHEFSEFFEGEDKWYLPNTKKKSTTSKIADKKDVKNMNSQDRPCSQTLTVQKGSTKTNT